MNSYERTLRTISFKEPDKIPLDIGSTLTTGIHKNTYEGLLSYLKIEEKIKIFDKIQQLALPSEEFLNKIDVDLQGIFLSGFKDWDYKECSDNNYLYFEDPWGIKYRMPISNGYYFDLYESPLKKYDINSIKNYNFPDNRDNSRYINLKEKIIEINNKKRFPVLGSAGYCFGLLQTLESLIGFENAFIEIAQKNKNILYLLDLLVEKDIEFWNDFFKYIKKDIKVICYFDDFADQRGLMLSPDIFKSIFKPRYKKIFDSIKKSFPYVKIFFHSCGAVDELLHDFIEMGIDILNPLQTSLYSISTSTLKKEYGKDIIFWGGGCDTQKILPFGSKKEIEEDVERRVNDLAPGGGFIFSFIHNIQPNVPVENIITALRKFNELRKY